MRVVPNAIAILLLSLTQAVSAAEPSSAAQDESASRLASRVRQAYERGEALPRDPTLYSQTISYGHGYDDPKSFPVKNLLEGNAKETDIMKAAADGFQTRLMRFLTDGNTIIAVTRTTAKLKDGSPFRADVVTFLTVENGRVAHIQTWPDRQQWTPMMKYLKAQPPASAKPAAGE